jgi:hypothetical protein
MTAEAPAANAQSAGNAQPEATPQDPAEARRQAARLMTYRMMPVWIFFLAFGITIVWESAVRGNAVTPEKLQAAALIALGFALFIGAPIGIRFFNPLPPKK